MLATGFFTTTATGGATGGTTGGATGGATGGSGTTAIGLLRSFPFFFYSKIFIKSHLSYDVLNSYSIFVCT